MPRPSFVPLFALVVMLVAPAISSALPTPGLNGAMTEAVYGRIFPEALETNDFVSFTEAVAGLDLLNTRHADLMEIHVVGQSAGLVNRFTGNRDTSDVMIVEVTNEASELAYADKVKSVFILSVHGNEKGGREGGLRAIEDLVAGKGIALEDPALTKMLDYQVVVFAFVNPDGWQHDEAAYVTDSGFTRQGGGGVDLNRQYATVGYLDQSAAAFRTYEQPEIAAASKFLRNLTNVVAGVDHHGMQEHDNFVAIMVKDGERTQLELAENERLAQSLKERLNANPYFMLFNDVPEIAGAWGGGDFAEWMSTYDAIGYSAAGTGGGFVVQDIGLNAPGFTVEMAYNHDPIDDKYPGAGAFMNAYHVRATRDMVITFMEFASEKASVRLDLGGARLAVLTTDFVATNADDDVASYTGWFTETDLDDDLDILHITFTASPNEYFRDLRNYLWDGEDHGALGKLASASELVASLSTTDTIVVPGSAVKKLAADPSTASSVRAWVEAGGNLVLTDDALTYLVDLGLVPASAVTKIDAYSGHSDVTAFDHPLMKGVRGAPRQTFDPNPLGFARDSSPVWRVATDAFKKAGGTPVGYADGEVNLGEIKLGAGTIRVFGAILPDPTESTPHPYGLDGYSVSLFGNQVLLNLMGLERDAPLLGVDLLSLLAAKVPDEPVSPAEAKSVPSASAVAALAVLGIAALVARRRK